GLNKFRVDTCHVLMTQGFTWVWQGISSHPVGKGHRMFPTMLPFQLGCIIDQLSQPAFKRGCLFTSPEMTTIVVIHISVKLVGSQYHLRIPFGADMPCH